MLRRATRASVNLKDTTVDVDIPDNDCAYGAYYLNCARVYDDSIPWELTEYRNSDIKQHKERIVEWMKRKPPSALPFIEMTELPAANKFYELGIEVTHDTLLLEDNFSAAMRSTGFTGRKAMFYKPSWLATYYTEPLRRMQGGWACGPTFWLVVLTVLWPGPGLVMLALYKCLKNR
jgi:hypothetical protein